MLPLPYGQFGHAKLRSKGDLGQAQGSALCLHIRRGESAGCVTV